MDQTSGPLSRVLVEVLQNDPQCPPIRELAVTRDYTAPATVIVVWYKNGYGQRIMIEDVLLAQTIDLIGLAAERIKMGWPSVEASYRFDPARPRLGGLDRLAEEHARW